MTEAWPSGLPTQHITGTLTEVPEDNVVEFAPETGPPLRRRSTSVATALVNFQTVWSSAEVATLDTFYRDTLKDGAEEFTRPHPRTGSTATFIFNSPPEYAHLVGDAYRVTFSLRKMP